MGMSRGLFMLIAGGFRLSICVMSLLFSSWSAEISEGPFVGICAGFNLLLSTCDNFAFISSFRVVSWLIFLSRSSGTLFSSSLRMSSWTLVLIVSRSCDDMFTPCVDILSTIAPTMSFSVFILVSCSAVLFSCSCFIFENDSFVIRDSVFISSESIDFIVSLSISFMSSISFVYFRNSVRRSSNSANIFSVLAAMRDVYFSLSLIFSICFLISFEMSSKFS